MSEETKVLGIRVIINGEEQEIPTEDARELYFALDELFGGHAGMECACKDDDLEGDCDCFLCRDDEDNAVESYNFQSPTSGTWSKSFDEKTGIYTFSTGFSNVGKG